MKACLQTKLLETNIFPKFHFGIATSFLYITKYHSQPTKVFIQFEKGDGALSENNYVFIVRQTNS